MLIQDVNIVVRVNFMILLLLLIHAQIVILNVQNVLIKLNAKFVLMLTEFYHYVKIAN